ncbi:MAG: hypothetical protein JNN20_01805 [Betaproteobacteria bacterium]|nr:hypothetical protein [Betaproteobacteria bacterium]
MKTKVFAISVACLLSACASMEPATQAPREEKIYTTGSNVPKKDRGDVTTVNKDSIANIQNNSVTGTTAGGR